jgi:hypothetical protein
MLSDPAWPMHSSRLCPASHFFITRGGTRLHLFPGCLAGLLPFLSPCVSLCGETRKTGDLGQNLAKDSKSP